MSTVIAATAEVTGASVENMGLIATGDADLALALADTVAQAYSGTGRFEGQQLPMIRGLASMYANMVQIVTLEGSGITSLEDLRGMRVSVGAPGSGTEVNAEAILSANGITYDDIEEQRLNFNETADALANGDIDAGFWSVGAPTSSILNLATTKSIVMIELSDAEMTAAQTAEPLFARTTLAGGTYEGVGDTAVLGVPNVLAVSSEMSDDVAYAITKRDVREHRRPAAPSTRRRTRPRSSSRWPRRRFRCTPVRSATTRKSAPKFRTACASERWRVAEGHLGGRLSALLLVFTMTAAAAGELVATAEDGTEIARLPVPEGTGWCVLWNHSVEGFEVYGLLREPRGPHGAGAFAPARLRRRPWAYPGPRAAGLGWGRRLLDSRHRRTRAGRRLRAAPRGRTGRSSAAGGRHGRVPFRGAARLRVRIELTGE
jgi:TRAP transporter TAXI family solute receptor